MKASRRHFLHTSCGLLAHAGLRHGGVHAKLCAGLAGMGAMAAQTSQAADSSSPYKALVCLFMSGGNDSHNWIVPTDPTGYAEYAAARTDLAWAREALSPIASTRQAAGRSFGMPQELEPLRRWYQAGHAAVVANVGPLVRPITRAEYLAGAEVPAKLFSHNDQASTWQSLWPEGASSGWGGRMGDLLASGNASPTFTAVSASANAVFLTGNSVTQYQMGVDGPVAISGLNSSTLFGSSTAPSVLRRTLAAAGTRPLQKEYARVVQRSVDAVAVLQTALAGAPAPAIPSSGIALGSGGSINLNDDPLARQLQMVAQMIAAAPALGMRRQVFMVSMGAFDSHANQMRDQPSQMARVAQSMDYFLSAMQSIGMLDNVVLFTASDFGRTLLSNGSGSDHGWGSHHFVAGGAVRGGDIYGRFPITALGGPDDIGSGRLLPTSAVTQFAEPMGRWLGLSTTDLAAVLPGLSNFNGGTLPFL